MTSRRPSREGGSSKRSSGRTALKGDTTRRARPSSSHRKVTRDEDEDEERDERRRPSASRKAPEPERRKKSRLPDPDEDEDPRDESTRDIPDEDSAPRPTKKLSKLGKKSSGKTGAVKRPSGARRAAPAPREGGGGFFDGLLVKIVGGVIVAILAIVGAFFSGSAKYDRNFEKIANGQTRAQVVQIMGAPDVALPLDDGGEVLGFEAIDRTGRRGTNTKHTFYFVTLHGGKVSEKERMTEAQFKARFGDF